MIVLYEHEIRGERTLQLFQPGPDQWPKHCTPPREPRTRRERRYTPPIMIGRARKLPCSRFISQDEFGNDADVLKSSPIARRVNSGRSCGNKRRYPVALLDKSLQEKPLSCRASDTTWVVWEFRCDVKDAQEPPVYAEPSIGC